MGYERRIAEDPCGAANDYTLEYEEEELRAANRDLL